MRGHKNITRCVRRASWVELVSIHLLPVCERTHRGSELSSREDFVNCSGIYGASLPVLPFKINVRKFVAKSITKYEREYQRGNMYLYLYFMNW